MRFLSFPLRLPRLLQCILLQWVSDSSMGGLDLCSLFQQLIFDLCRECQRTHWDAEHRKDCRTRYVIFIFQFAFPNPSGFSFCRSNLEMVGQPFIVSLPKSKCTYSHLMRVLEARCRYEFFYYDGASNFIGIELIELLRFLRHKWYAWNV